MSRVSEHDATVAVEAAARKVYEGVREQVDGSLDPEWEELEPLQKRPFREAVLPIVWAALEALPDNRRAAWQEGWYARNDGRWDDQNPYLTS